MLQRVNDRIAFKMILFVTANHFDKIINNIYLTIITHNLKTSVSLFLNAVIDAIAFVVPAAEIYMYYTIY